MAFDNVKITRYTPRKKPLTSPPIPDDEDGDPISSILDTGDDQAPVAPTPPGRPYKPHPDSPGHTWRLPKTRCEVCGLTMAEVAAGALTHHVGPRELHWAWDDVPRPPKK